MPMDAVCMSAAAEELRRAALGARIDKIQQPSRDQIVMLLPRGMRLLINAGTNQPRMHLTRLLRENPAQPPMFCMLLRKHLTGAKLIAVEQPEMERVLILTLEGRDELGELCRRKLVLEAMGRQANLLLLDSEDRIIDCMRRVDLDLSDKRQLLPGLFYHLPPAQADKYPPWPWKMARFQLCWKTQKRMNRSTAGFCAPFSVFLPWYAANWPTGPAVPPTPIFLPWTPPGKRVYAPPGTH